MTNPTLDRAKIEAIKAQSGSMDGGAIMFALVGDVRALCDLALEALSGAAPSVSASPVAPETVKEALRDMIGAYMHVAGNEYRGDIDGLVEELAPYVVGLRSTSDRAASPASPPRPVEAAPVAWPDRETLRRQIESDPDEGEIGAGFELFSERGQQELERLAFEALPKWAQEHIRDLERQIASPPREPEGMDAATVEACAVTAERFILQYATSSRDIDVVMQGAAKEDAAAEIAAAIRSLAPATPSRRVG